MKPMDKCGHGLDTKHDCYICGLEKERRNYIEQVDKDSNSQDQQSSLADSKMMTITRFAWDEKVDHIKQLNAEIQRLTEERDRLEKRMKNYEYQALKNIVIAESTEDRAIQAEQERDAYREALEFYADESIYDTEHLSKHGYIIIDKDAGERARQTLAQYSKGDTP
jgi:cell division protein FtsB